MFKDILHKLQNPEWREWVFARFQGLRGKLRRPSTKREMSVKVLVVDEVLDPRGKPRAAYWWATVLKAEMQELNPRAYGGYSRKPTQLRRVVWLLGIGVGVAMGFVYSYISLISPTIDVLTVIVISGITGAFSGMFLGLPIAWAINRFLVRTEILYVVGRVGEKAAEKMGLVIPEGAKYALVWATPPPLMLLEDSGTDEMADESEDLLWTHEALELGVDGWATQQYLRGMGAAVNRENAKWGGNVGDALSHNGAAPGNGVGPLGKTGG